MGPESALMTRNSRDLTLIPLCSNFVRVLLARTYMRRLHRFEVESGIS
jgi:hypothetical protein